MNGHNEERIRNLIKQAIPQVAEGEPARDLWPDMLRRLDAAEEAPSWFDWVLTGGALMTDSQYRMKVNMNNTKTSRIDTLIESLTSEGIPCSDMGRRERKAAETRLKLFRCALQLFAERGFPNVTVEDITETADVGKGTFFNYFKGKDQVLSVMAEIQLWKVRQSLKAAEANNRSIRSVLHDHFRKVCEESGRSPELARALLTAFFSSTHRDLLAQNLANARRMAERILQLGQERGEVDPKLKTEQTALQLQQSFLGTMLFWSLTGEQLLQTAVEVSFQYFWRAIAIKD